MIRVLILIAFIASMLLALPLVYTEFTIWDAGNPGDDESYLIKLLRPLTPSVSPFAVNQAMELYTLGPVIDVRSREEFDEGHIPGAVLVPEKTLYTKIPQMFASKLKTIYLYDNTGYKGAVSTRLLRNMGYENSFNITGGFEGWKKAGYKLEPMYY